MKNIGVHRACAYNATAHATDIIIIPNKKKSLKLQ